MAAKDAARYAKEMAAYKPSAKFAEELEAAKKKSKHQPRLKDVCSSGPVLCVCHPCAD